MTRQNAALQPSRTGKTALITGASSGIGRELAQEFARHGHDVVLLARRAERLSEAAQELTQLYGVRAKVLVKDLADADAPAEVLAELESAGIKLDFLVNNAGIGTYGDFLATEPPSIERMLELNIMALTKLTRLVAASMAERRSGAILNVASTAAFQPGPHMAGYYASKAFVLSLSEALAFELAPLGVTVSTLCPGPTVSEFQASAKMESARMVRNGRFMTTSAEVARAAYKGLIAGKVIIIPGIANNLAARTVSFLPRCLVTRVSAFLAAGAAAKAS